MLSKWIKSVKSSLSPKAWLAKRLAQTLNDLFILGKEHQIESNLLKDTKIVLRNARIRPRQLNDTAWLQGNVEEMEFSWTWGGPKGAGGFVKDTKMSIRGAKFRVVVGAEDMQTEDWDLVENKDSQGITASERSMESRSSEGSNTSQTNSTEGYKRKGYIQREIEQIMDNLTVDISDMELIVETDESQKEFSGICLEFKGLHLISLGRQEFVSFDELPGTDTTSQAQNNPLSQRISMESISARVLLSPTVQGEPQPSLPLLDPIGYAASATRVAGRRFLDGFSTGLEIVGDVLLVPQECYESGLVVHAGKTQIESICRLINHWRPSNIDTISGAVDADEEVEERGKLAIGGPATTIAMPLPAVCIVLPEDTKIRMPSCSLRCNVDGTVFHIEGNQGIWIGNEPFLRIGGVDSEHNPACGWKIDFVGNRISLNQVDSPPSSLVARVEWNDVVMKQLAKEFGIVLSSLPRQLVQQAKTALEETEEMLRSRITKWVFEASGTIGVRISCEVDWVEASIASPSLEIASMSDTGNIRIVRLEASGMEVGPMSFGELGSTRLHVPGVSLQKTVEGGEATCLVVEDCIEGTLESESVPQELKNLFMTLVSFEQSTVQKEPQANRDQENSTLPTLLSGYSVLIPECKLALKQPKAVSIIAQGVRLQDCLLEAAAVSFVGDHISTSSGHLLDVRIETTKCLEKATLLSSKMTIQGGAGEAKMTGLRATYSPSGGELSVQQLSTLRVEHVFNLLDPIQNISMTYRDGILDMGELAARGVCLLMARPDTAGDEKSVEEKETASLPFVMQCRLSYLQLLPISESSSSLHVAGASLRVSQSGTELVVESISPFKVRIVDSTNQEWIQASIGPASACLDFTSASLLRRASCEGATIGPYSKGQVNITIPSIAVNKQLAVRCGDVSAVLQSIDLVESIQQLYKRCFPSKSTKTPPFSVSIPKAIVNIPSLNVTVVGESIASSSPFHQASCLRFGLQDKGGKSAAFAGLTVQLDPFLGVAANQIDAFYIPGVCSLERPGTAVSKVVYRNDVWCLEIPPVQLVLLGGKSQESNGGIQGQPSSEFNLPSPVQCTFQEMILRPASSNEEQTRIRNLTCRLDPSGPPASANQAAAINSIQFQMNLDGMDNKLMKIWKMNVSGILRDSIFSTVHQLRVVTEAAEVTAGLSSLDWSSAFGSDSSKPNTKPVSLPFAMVKGLVVQIKCTGVIGVGKTAVDVPPFRGGPNTTLDNLMHHFKNAVLNRVPAMVTNTAVMGNNVSTLAAQTAGVVMAGSAAGSLIGLVAEDGIRGAVENGKKSRRASAGEKYRFGDFTRGAIRAIGDTVKSGGEIRRGDRNDGYAFGDFSAGATNAAAEYAFQNTSRIGAAGISGVGMVLGCAVAGPLGLVAGSLLGSKAGQEVFRGGEASSQNPQPNPQSTPQRQQQGQRQSQVGHAPQQAPSNRNSSTRPAEDFNAFDGVDFHSW